MKTINYSLSIVLLLILCSCTKPTSSIVSEVSLDSIQQSYETIIVDEQKPFALPTFIEQNISPYYHYSTVPWKEIKQTYYRPYSADWGDEIESMMEDSFPADIACDMWAKLQNAKCKFHQDNLPLRAICDAVNHYTKVTLHDRFQLMSVAFQQPLYRVDSEWNEIIY